jgi:hypothetical protein
MILLSYSFMSMTIKQLAEGEIQEYVKSFSTNRLPSTMKQALERDGWEFTAFSMTKRIHEYHLYIEFCIGDFCVSLGSKKRGWLLELPKKRCSSFPEALIETEVFARRIGDGEHWQGEED